MHARCHPVHRGDRAGHAAARGTAGACTGRCCAARIERGQAVPQTTGTNKAGACTARVGRRAHGGYVRLARLVAHVHGVRAAGARGKVNYALPRDGEVLLGRRESAGVGSGGSGAIEGVPAGVGRADGGTVPGSIGGLALKGPTLQGCPKTLPHLHLQAHTQTRLANVLSNREGR
eukprot:scaffold180883_cov22-Tisochrysis_lutea.AAC.4